MPLLTWLHLHLTWLLEPPVMIDELKGAGGPAGGIVSTAGHPGDEVRQRRPAGSSRGGPYGLVPPHHAPAGAPVARPVGADDRRHVQRLAALMGSDCQMLGLHPAPTRLTTGSCDWWRPHPAPTRASSRRSKTTGRLDGYDSGREVYLGVRLTEKARPDGRRSWGSAKPPSGSTEAMPRPTQKQLGEYGRLAQRALNRVQPGLSARVLPTRKRSAGFCAAPTGDRSRCLSAKPNRPAWGGEAHALLNGAQVENDYHYLHVIRRDGARFWVAVLGFSASRTFGDGTDGDMTAGWLNLARGAPFPGRVPGPLSGACRARRRSRRWRRSPPACATSSTTSGRSRISPSRGRSRSRCRRPTTSSTRSRCCAARSSGSGPGC